MARPDVVLLREFYASPLGRLVRRALIAALQKHWPELSGDTLGGIGYANPVLRHYLKEESQDRGFIFSMMPAAQGAIVWPDYSHNRVVLLDESLLPVPDNYCNRILLLHALENAESEAALLRECWRILTPGGRLVAMVPHRPSIWASAVASPFAYGRPYRISQLRDALCHHQFTHIHTSTTLFFIPSTHRWLMKLSAMMQRFGQFATPLFGGVIIMEVEKQLYAGIKERVADRHRRPVYAPAGGKPALSKLRNPD